MIVNNEIDIDNLIIEFESISESIKEKNKNISEYINLLVEENKKLKQIIKDNNLEETNIQNTKNNLINKCFFCKFK